MNQFANIIKHFKIYILCQWLEKVSTKQWQFLLLTLCGTRSDIALLSGIKCKRWPNRSDSYIRIDL